MPARGASNFDRDMQNRSYRVIVDMSANILNFTVGATKCCWGASMQGPRRYLLPPILKHIPPPLPSPGQGRRHGATIGGKEDHLKSILSMHRP